MKMKSITMALTLALMLALTPGTVLAVQNEGGYYWSFSVSEPQSLTRSGSVQLEFTLLSTNDSPENYEIKGFRNDVEVDSLFTNPDSGFLSIPLPGDGDYELYAVAENLVTNSTEESTKQTITYDGTAPNEPNYNDFDRNGGTITLNFAAADADTSKIAIYGSSSPTFTANTSTKLGEVDDSNTSFTYNANTDAERFHAIQAVDAAGNRSDLVGDENVTVIDETQTTQEETTTTGTTADDGSVLGEQDTGEDTQDEPTQDTSSASTDDEAGDEDGQVAGVQDEANNEMLPLWAWTLISLIGVALIGLLISRFRDDFSEMFRRNRQ